MPHHINGQNLESVMNLVWYKQQISSYICFEVNICDISVVIVGGSRLDLLHLHLKKYIYIGNGLFQSDGKPDLLKIS